MYAFISNAHTEDGEVYVKVQWGEVETGFGEFEFTTRRGSQMEIKTEFMSAEFVKRVLCKMVDNAMLID